MTDGTTAPAPRPPTVRKHRSEPVWGKTWLSVRHVERFVRENASLCTGRGIDYGCGNMPYSGWVRDHADELLGVDVAQSSDHVVDVVIEPGAPLPFEDGSLDFVLCTQVLEHVPDPDRHLAEMSRVLKPGGVLLLTLPFVWEQHEVPHDYFRFTEFGIRHLATKNGLRFDRLEPSGGMIECVTQVAVFRLPSFGCLNVLIYGPINLLGAALDRLLRLDRITCNWHCVLRKI